MGDEQKVLFSKEYCCIYKAIMPIVIILERFIGLGRICGLSILVAIYYIALWYINDDVRLFVQCVPSFVLGVIARCKLQGVNCNHR